jgi:hypothetical protein
VAVRFIGRETKSKRRKTTDLPQVTDKLYHISKKKEEEEKKKLQQQIV